MENVYETFDGVDIEIHTDIVDEVQSKKRKKRIYIIIFLICMVLIGIGGKLYIDSLAYKICYVEAGTTVLPTDFLKNTVENAVFAENSEVFDITQPGEYRIRVNDGMFTHSSTLIIQDTIAPEAETVPVKLEMGNTCEAESFISNLKDATQVTISYEIEPDFEQAGLQIVQIVLTDKGNNQTSLEAELFITQVIDSVTIEAGDEAPSINSFVLAAKEAEFITDITEFDYTKVDEHKVLLKVDGKNYTSILYVIDTIPPTAEVRDIEGYAILPRKVEDFILKIDDITEVNVAFRNEPDLTQIGTQQLEIVFTDSGNNEITKQVNLTLIEDKEAPIIHGAADMRVFIGTNISYKKNVTVTDNCMEGLLFTVDTSKVNINAEGIYPVTYIAKDAAGNTTSTTVTLSVVPRVYDINEVNSIADSVLAGIVSPSMGERDKITAIYNYVTKHVKYINSSEKGNYIRAAYEGLVDKRGDCYVYACTTKVLLTRAGITNVDIEKIPTNSVSYALHYWNLVLVDGGWYHVDTTPRKDKTVILMWTDAQLMDYSARHNGSHNYDRSAYPQMQ